MASVFRVLVLDLAFEFHLVPRRDEVAVVDVEARMFEEEITPNFLRAQRPRTSVRPSSRSFQFAEDLPKRGFFPTLLP